jgi:holo-[acyl-carrier protein] synthase
MADNLARFGERFARRILNQAEMDAFRTAASPAPYLSKRFAAKEAAAKALGTGFRDGLSLQDIGVSNDALGKPVLDFSARARARLQAAGIGQVHLSLADERDYAIAYVIFETAQGADFPLNP